MKTLMLCILLVMMTACSQEPASFNNAPMQSWSSVKECVDDALAKTKPTSVTGAHLYEASQVCLSQMHGEGSINDFRIRRLKFTQQTYDERVLLWMVVCITLSGVVLAGVQMVASFRLATIGKESFAQTAELAVEQGKLSLKSSVTGLFILICSFAFFWVFVYEIFVLKIVDVDAGRQTPPVMESKPVQLGAGPFAPSAAAPKVDTPAKQ